MDRARADPAYYPAMRPRLTSRLCLCFSVVLATGRPLGVAHAWGAGVPTPPALESRLSAALGGAWTRSGDCDHPVHFALVGDTLRVVGVDAEMKLPRSAD